MGVSRATVLDPAIPTNTCYSFSWLGDYDFAWLCTPVLPWMKSKKSRAPPFYAIDADLPLLLAIVCGFQHSLAMLAGLITPPYVLNFRFLFSYHVP